MSQYLSGEEFVKLNPGKKFYKLTHEKEIHTVIFDSDNGQTMKNRMEYTDGLVVDKVPFNPSSKPGGLYFTDLENLPLWTCNKHWIREVTILPDAQVYVEETRLKADKLLLSPRIPIEDFEAWEDREYCLKAVKKHPYVLNFINESKQFLELCFTAVKRHYRALKFVANIYKTPEIISMAIKSNIKAFAFVPYEKQTYEMCLQAVKTYKFAILHVKYEYKTPELCLEAVKFYPFAIKYIRKQTLDLCLEALKQNFQVFEYIKDEFKTAELLKQIKINGYYKFDQNYIEKYLNEKIEFTLS